jgi:hypothetical protein
VVLISLSGRVLRYLFEIGQYSILSNSHLFTLKTLYADLYG